MASNPNQVQAGIEGLLYSGSNSNKVPASLRYTSDGQISITALDEEAHEAIKAHISALTFSSRLGSTPRFITLNTQQQFECSDNDAVDRLIKTANQQGHLNTHRFANLAHYLESKRRVILATLIIVALLAFAFVKFGIPYLSAQLALALPAETSQHIGQGSLDMLDKSIMQPSEIRDEHQAALQKQFQEIKQTLEVESNKGLSHLELIFRKSDTLGANAFALPSGTIILTDAMVNMAENDRQLQAVLLHEIGHIIHRHSLRQMIQQSSLALFIILLTGDISNASSALLALPGILLQAGYSQSMELEADDFALDHLQQFGLTQADFASLMSKLLQQEQVKGMPNDGKQAHKPETSFLDYLSSHPAPKDRLDHIQAIKE